MEIEFSPSQLPPLRSKSETGRGTTASDSQPVAPELTTTPLQAALAALPSTRPDKVDQARTLAADPSYPPDYVVDRIVTLLAIHLRY